MAACAEIFFFRSVFLEKSQEGHTMVENISEIEISFIDSCK